MKKVMALLLVSTLLFTLTACSGDTVEPTAIVLAIQPANESGEASATVDSTRQNVEILSSTPSVEYDSDDLDSDVSEPDISYIKLEGNSITLDGSGAIVEGNVITITAAGTYSVSGTLNDGQIRVNTEDQETVKLILNGADIACATCAPIYVVNADKTVITLADGTENYVTDGAATSYEGIESAVITINNGNIHIVANDDGINVVSGEGEPAPMGRPPGRDMFDYSGDNYLYVNGGYVAIDSVGDGLDVNGSVNLAGGVVIINGPISQGNGALDYYGDFKITGGFLAAVGSSGMAEAPGMSSSQYSVMLTFPSPMPAGTMIHLEAETGEDILTLVPTKEYQTVVLSSPELKNGSTYIVYTGGSSTGTMTDGLYSEGTYTAGTQYTSFTVSSIVTIEGSYGGGFQGGRRRGP